MWLLATGIQGSDLSWANQTHMHPVGFALVCVLGAATLIVPRNYALIPLFIMACFVAPAQRLVVVTLDFTLIRIMLLFVVARIVARQEYKGLKWTTLDSLVAGVWLANSFVYIAQWGTTGAVVYRLGVGFEAMGVYFFARIVIRDWSDLIQFARAAALLSIPVAAFFLVENSTGRNLFSVFGGVPEITGIREGRLRCQGPFAHAIIAGVFWASLVPLFVALLWQGGKDRFASVAGVAGSLTIVFCCASSTPVLALVAGVVGALFFPLRGRMKYVVWATICLLTFLHIIMLAPVWHLISRVSAVGGSTSWHRYHLIDQTIRHFGEWAVLGTKSTGHWGHALNDVTNHYILHAVTGGLVTLLLFVGLLVVAFRGVGTAVRRVRSHRSKLVLAWAIGVMLFVHCMCFIGVSYFGQADLVWFLSLAIAANLATALSANVARAESLRSIGDRAALHRLALRSASAMRPG